MKSITEAFLDGEISTTQLWDAYDLQEQAKAAITRGENKLPNGLHIRHYEGIIGQDGTAILHDVTPGEDDV